MSPRTKAQFEEIRQRSIATIKQAALELFAHKGYHSTSILQISKEAGISKGLIYNYFSGKEELLHAIIMDVVNMGEKLLVELLATTDDPFELLEHITAASFTMVRNNLQYWKLLTSLAFQTEVLEKEKELLHEKQAEATAVFTRIFKKMGYKNPRQEAYFYEAAMDGIMIHYMQLEEGYPLAEMKEFVLARYRR